MYRLVGIQQRPNFYQVNYKDENKYQLVQSRIYHSCEKIAIFMEKDSMQQKFSF